jgi:serine/threonine protein kinase
LAGRPPFEAETAEEVARRHISDRPPPLRSFCPHAQEQTVFTLDKCLNKDPEGRWSNYEDFIRQMADALRRNTSEI